MIDEFFTPKMQYILPKEQTAVGNGYLIRIDEDKNKRTFLYQAEQPISIILLSSDKFNHLSKEDEGITYTAFYLRGYEYVAQRILDETIYAFKYYQKWFGSFPLDQYVFVLSKGNQPVEVTSTSMVG
jgi:hypothetical protein